VFLKANTVHSTRRSSRVRVEGVKVKVGVRLSDKSRVKVYLKLCDKTQQKSFCKITDHGARSMMG